MTRRMIELPDGTLVAERRGGFKITIETGLAIAAVLVTLGGLVVYANRVPALEEKQNATSDKLAALSQKVEDIEKGQTRMMDFLERKFGR